MTNPLDGGTNATKQLSIYGSLYLFYTALCVNENILFYKINPKNLIEMLIFTTKYVLEINYLLQNKSKIETSHIINSELVFWVCKLNKKLGRANADWFKDKILFISI